MSVYLRTGHYRVSRPRWTDYTVLTGWAITTGWAVLQLPLGTAASVVAASSAILAWSLSRLNQAQQTFEILAGFFGLEPRTCPPAFSGTLPPPDLLAKWGTTQIPSSAEAGDPT